MNIKYKILLGILFVYFIIMGIMFFYYSSHKVDLYISPNLSIEYYKGKYKKTNFNKNKIYNIYIDGILKYTGKLELRDDSTYFNENKLDNFLASNKKIKTLNFEKEDISLESAKEILNEFGFNDFLELTVSNKINIDYDNDGQVETIYYFSNVFANEPQNQIFTIMYTIDNNKKKILYNQTFNEDINGCVGYISDIIDINNDNKFELIYKCTYFDKIGTKLKIYNLKDNNYKLITEI